MQFETLDISSQGPARVIRLNRPTRRNAISFRMMEEVAAAVRLADDEPAVRAVVITGGDDCFSSGGDLTEGIALRTAADVRKAVQSWQHMNGAIEGSAKPVIAAIEGFCLTGGCELALACDLRVAGEGAMFGITSSKIGTIPGAGGTQRLPRIVGIANALQLMFAADPIDAAEAFRIGLVNILTPRGGALARGMALADVYAQRAPVSLALIKRAVHQGMRTDLATGLELEGALDALAYATADKQEGISAFLEKRAPVFRGE